MKPIARVPCSVAIRPTRKVLRHGLLVPLAAGALALAPAAAAAALPVPRVFVALGMENNAAYLATDSAGNFYAAGAAKGHVMVAKIDGNGKVLYSKTFGGSGVDRPSGIAVDGTGSSYVVGDTSSSDFPVVNSLSNKGSMFCAKLSPDGTTLLYSTLLGAGGATAVAVDSSGAAYITGLASSPGLVSTPGAFQTTSKGQDAYVMKLGPDGKTVFATFLGGNGACNSPPAQTCFGLLGGVGDSDAGSAIGVDAAGNVYVAGVTNAADFPVTPGAFQTKYPNPAGVPPNGFVSKLSPDGSTLLYSSYLGTAEGEYLNTLLVNGAGEVLVGGNTYSSAFPTTAGAVYPAPHAAGSIVARLNAQGSALLYATYLGSGNVNGVVADNAGNLNITGYADLGPFPVTAGALPAGVSYFAQLSADGKSLTYSTLLPFGAAGNAVAVGASGTPAVMGAAGVLTIFGTGDSAAPAVYALANTAGPYIDGQVAPGEVLSLFGVNLGPDQAVALALTPSGFVATNLGGVQVRFNNVLAPMIMSQKNQVNFQVPYEISNQGVTTMQISSAAGNSQVYTLPVIPADPGILTLDGTYAAAINLDGSINGSDHPVILGDIVTLFVTGSGAWNGNLQTGQVSPIALVLPALPVKAYVVQSTSSQVEADVLYAGSAPFLTDGVLQVNLRLPGPDALGLTAYNFAVLNLAVQVGGTQSPSASIWTQVRH